MLPLDLNRGMCALLDGRMLLQLKEDSLESPYSWAQLAQDPTPYVWKLQLALLLYCVLAKTYAGRKMADLSS